VIEDLRGFGLGDAELLARILLVREGADERRRDGAYRWGVFEDTADPSRFVETFLVDSWLEH
jgi:hypothetical protein